MALKCVTDEEFVKLWQTYEGSVQELAESLGVRKSVLTDKASYMRSLGIPLRRFPRCDKTRNVKKLTKIAGRLVKAKDSSTQETAKHED